MIAVAYHADDRTLTLGDYNYLQAYNVSGDVLYTVQVRLLRTLWRSASSQCLFDNTRLFLGLTINWQKAENSFKLNDTRYLGHNLKIHLSMCQRRCKHDEHKTLLFRFKNRLIN